MPPITLGSPLLLCSYRLAYGKHRCKRNNRILYILSLSLDCMDHQLSSKVCTCFGGPVLFFRDAATLPKQDFWEGASLKTPAAAKRGGCRPMHPAILGQRDRAVTILLHTDLLKPSNFWIQSSPSCFGYCQQLPLARRC